MDLARNNKNDDNRDEIIRYLREGGDESGLPLTELQSKILHRWRVADEKIRERKYSREQICKLVMSICTCSRDTAFKAMSDAEHVFASSYPMNKKYAVMLRIDYLIMEIQELKIKKQFVAAAIQEKNLQKYIDMYPEETPAHSPKNVFYIFNNAEADKTVDVEAVYAESEAILKELEDKDDY